MTFSNVRKLHPCAFFFKYMPREWSLSIALLNYPSRTNQLVTLGGAICLWVSKIVKNELQRSLQLIYTLQATCLVLNIYYAQPKFIPSYRRLTKRFRLAAFADVLFYIHLITISSWHECRLWFSCPPYNGLIGHCWLIYV